MLSPRSYIRRRVLSRKMSALGQNAPCPLSYDDVRARRITPNGGLDACPGLGAVSSMQNS